MAHNNKLFGAFLLITQTSRNDRLVVTSAALIAVMIAAFQVRLIRLSTIDFCDGSVSTRHLVTAHEAIRVDQNPGAFSS
jgi:hypothetical protein